MRRPAGRRGELLLALETSGDRPSVALARGAELLAERRCAPGRPGREPLLPAIDALLRGAGVALADVAAFALAVGPGSFTGLRIGVATLKGLAFGSGAPVAAVGTLDALALRAPRGEGPVVAVLDARRGEVYAAGFAWRGDALAPADPPEGLYAAAELVARLPARCTLVGDGLAVCGAAARARLGRGLRAVAPPRGRPRAREVALLGAALLGAGRGVDVADLVPRYLRRAEAEVRRTGLATEPPPA